jgi:hypothetical protein
VPHNLPATIIKDTLVYSYQNIKQRASDCGNKPDSECTIVNINYAFFPGQKKLNDSIEQKLTNLFQLDDVASTANFKVFINGFLKSYYNDKKLYPDWVGSYALNIFAKILRQDSSLTTLKIGGYAFQSGARGFTSTCFINWNTTTNKNITLADLFIKGYNDKLNKIGDTIFRKEEKLSDTASLVKNYSFSNGTFVLNSNFSVTPVGIRFLFNEAEIKTFAAGQTNILIPYSKIKSLLLPHTVVAQYIK